MRVSAGTRYLHIIFAFLVSFGASAQTVHNGGSAGAKHITIEEIAMPQPTLMPVLGSSTFVPFEVRELSNATLAYLDYDYFRARGVEIPPEGIRSPKLAADALRAFAWMTPNKNDPPSAFGSRVRTMFAYFYGGYGLGGNIGSGRSAAFGDFDEKGLPTPLIKSNNPYHSNGAVQTIEGVDEAIWSKILDAETQFGSNRVVAVIFTNTYAGIEGEDRKFPRALIVREMAVRPAHHMLNYSRDTDADTARVRETLASLLGNLPYPKNVRPKTDHEALHEGILEMARREAQTQAEMFAKRLYFGSNSPSNLEIAGRRLDLGDHTSVPGYTKIFRIDDDSPFGETSEFKKVQEDFRQSLLRMLKPELVSAVPTQQQVEDVFDRTFSGAEKFEMLKLTGAPIELLNAMAGSRASEKMGKLISEVARLGNSKPVFMEPAGYENTSTYDLAKVLQELASAPSGSVELIDSALKKTIANGPLRGRLARAYFEFRREMKLKGRKFAISDSALGIYMREAVQLRNRTRESLIRGDRRWHELWDLTNRALDEKNGMLTQDYIERQIERNRVNFKDARPFELVLSETANKAEGTALRQVFNLKTNRYSSVVRIDVANGTGHFKGTQMSATEWANASLEHGELRAAAKLSGTHVEFEFSGAPEIELKTVIINPTASKSIACDDLFGWVRRLKP